MKRKGCSSFTASMDNIAYDLKRPVRWNPQTETFVNDPEADKHLHRPYREGYKLA